MMRLLMIIETHSRACFLFNLVFINLIYSISSMTPVLKSRCIKNFRLLYVIPNNTPGREDVYVINKKMLAIYIH